MKRILCLSLALTMLCAMLTFITANAAESGDLTYENRGDHVIITGCDKNAVSVEIPAEIDSLPVTGIEEFAFNGSGLTNITIPNTVTDIGRYAFNGCRNLTAVVLPENLERIDEGVFWDCINLKELKFPEKITYIGASAFRGDKNLSNIIIPDNTIEIGDHAFFGCISLSNVFVPEKVSKIGSSAFSGCTDLTQIVVADNNAQFRDIDGVLFNKDVTEIITCPGGKVGLYIVPNTIQNITSNSFYNCNKITEIKIPANVSDIAGGAFSYCINLKNVYVDEDNNSFCDIDGILFNKNITEIYSFPPGKSKELDEYVIPSSVSNIREYAFSSCSFKSVFMPDSIIKISAFAFSSCKYLNKIVLPESITFIEEYAFYNCKSLTGIKIPSKITTINTGVFSYCSSLKGVEFPAKLTHICGHSFTDCDSLTDVYYNGNIEDWSNINIESYNNEYLLKAQVHYKSTMPIEPMLFITNYTDTSVTIEAVNISDLRTTVVLAVYEKNGALRFMTTRPAAEAVGFNDIDLRNSKIKVMLWSDADSIKPLTEAAEMSL